MIRPLEPRDVPAAVALAADRASRTDERWWRLWLGAGAGVCEDAPGGGLAGAAVVCDLGGRVAALPALAVARAHAGHGLGRRLVEAAAALHPGLPLRLHAPASAAPRLLALGFAAAGAVTRHSGIPGPAAPPGARLRPLGVADLPAVVALDEAATGAPRRNVLERLLPIAERACVAAEGGRVVGYGLAWPLADGVAVGPVIAESDGAATAIARYLAAGHTARLWVPDGGALGAWAASAGLRPDGTATLLVRGRAPAPSRAGRLHALCAPGIG